MKLEELISRDYALTGTDKWLHAVEHDSLVVNVEKQLWYWNSRGLSGDSYGWLTRVKGLSHNEAKEFLRVNDHQTSYAFISTIQNKNEVVTYPKLVDVFYEEGLEQREYWYKRQLTDATIHRFKLGYHDGWSTIPIYQDGLFRNFQLRRDIPAKQIKSYYKGVGRLLFNSDILRLVDSVYVTEGPTDALRLIQEGLPVVSHNGGSEAWDDSWFKYFAWCKNIYIIYDNDSAGRNGSLNLAKHLGVYKCHIYTFDGFDDKYDVGDFFRDGGTKEQFKDLVHNQSKYAFELELRKEQHDSFSKHTSGRPFTKPQSSNMGFGN